MAIKDIFKVSRKTFFDPRAWLGYDILKEETRTVWEIVKSVFVPEKPEAGPPEVFAEVVKRYQLSEKDLKNMSLTYFAFAVFFGIVGIGFIGFCIFLLKDNYFAGALLAVAVGLFFFGQAFRYHFWHFQIKNKKLGCTFEEWRNGKIYNEESKS